MINKSDHYAAWALLLYELEDAREHLDRLILHLVESGTYDEIELSVDMAHIYAHLNRFWHARNQTTKITDEQWPDFSQFPEDLNPTG